MKNLIVAIFILSALVTGFSFGEIPAGDFTKDHWGASGSNPGSQPGKGEAGEAEVFALEQSEKKNATPLQTEETEQNSIFTVSVKQKPVWEYILYGVAITLAIQVIVLGIVAIILWIKSRK